MSCNLDRRSTSKRFCTGSISFFFLSLFFLPWINYLFPQNQVFFCFQVPLSLSLVFAALYLNLYNQPSCCGLKWCIDHTQSTINLFQLLAALLEMTCFTYSTMFPNFICESFPANHDCLSSHNFWVSSSWLICNNWWYSYIESTICPTLIAMPMIRHKNIFKMTHIHRKQAPWLQHFGAPISWCSNSSQGFGHMSENNLLICIYM